MSRAKLFAILGLLLGGVLAVFALDRLVEARRQQHFDLVVAIRDLTRFQNNLAEEILRLRQDLALHYDGLVEIQDRTKATSAVIEGLVQTQAGDLELHKAYQAFDRACEAQRVAVERFKSLQSLDRNARHYLSTLASLVVAEIHDAAQSIAIKLELEQIVLDSVSAILASKDEAALRARIRDLSARLESSGLAGARAFLVHADFALANRQRLDREIRSILDHEVRDSIDALRAMHEEKLGRALKTADSQRVALWAIAGGFALLSVFALLRLRQTNEALAARNEGLEDEIRSRSAQIAQSQKLESIGQLAAGIAHEINTPAQYVGDNLEFLEQSVGEIQPLLAFCTALAADRTGPEDSPEASIEKLVELSKLAAELDLEFFREELPRAIVQSREGVGRISKIVLAMKEFSHPGSGEKKPVDLNHALQSTIMITGNEWKYVAEVETDLASDLPLVPVLAGELNQVFLNLLVNAAQAIAESGRGTEEARGHIGVTTRLDDGFAVIEISDDGAGIPAEIVDRIFDPFFTTKEVGKGTGQGLAIARSMIVDRHGGTLSVESELGRGTTFRIRLPLGESSSEAIAS